MRAFSLLLPLFLLTACFSPAEMKDARYQYGQYTVSSILIQPLNAKVAQNVSYPETKRSMEGLLQQKLPRKTGVPSVMLIITLDKVGTTYRFDGQHQYPSHTLYTTISGVAELRDATTGTLVAHEIVGIYAEAGPDELRNPSTKESGSLGEELLGAAFDVAVSDSLASDLGAIGPDEAEAQEKLVDFIIHKFYP